MRTRHLIMLILACLFQIQFVFSQTNKLYIPPTDCPFGKTTNVEMQMDNQAEIVALQFNLHIPDVVTLDQSGIQLTEERKDDHKLSVTDKGDNNYLVVVLSINNKAFKNASGALIKIPLVVPDGLEIEKEHPFQLTNVVLSDRSGKNVMTSFDPGKIKIVDGNGPDITSTNIQLSSDDFKPGGKVSLTWNVENIGGKPTEGGWSEQLYLVDESGNEYSLGSGRYEEIIPSKGTVSRQAEYTIDDYPGIEGKVKAKVILTAFSGWELPAYRENNEGMSDAGLDMPKVLTLRINATSIREQDTHDIFCFLNRSGSRKMEETFTIQNSNTNRLELPTSVTIPTNESGVSLVLKTKNDEIANKDSFAIVTISGNGYTELEQEIWIEDDETPALAITTPNETLQEGQTFNLMISRPWETKWPLTVKLATDHPKRFSFDTEVTIPANASSVTVPVQTINDDKPDVPIDAVFMVSKSGYETGRGFVKLEDDDVPDITLDITPATFAEGAGAQAAIATLRRTKVTNNKITVKLTDTSKGMLYYPTSSITLDTGETEYQFAIGVSDNDLQDGDRTVQLTAAVYISSCSCSTAGTSAGTVTKDIVITDNDGPTLKIASSQSALIEGKKEATQLTITRNTSTDEALTVNLSCDLPNDVILPSSVTIPAGKASVTIPVEAKSNETTEGNRTIAFIVTAEGFSSGTCWAMITDQTLPDADLSSLQVQGSSFFARGEIEVEILLENKGVVALPPSTKISVYLSSKNQLGASSEQVLLGNIYTTSALVPGGSETLKRTFVFPDKTGIYYIIAVADEDQNVKETIKTNNTTTPLEIRLEPLYKVQISTDKGNYQPGETIVITGQATGGKVANVPVDLYVRYEGYQQIFNVITDAQGIFQYSYTPVGWMMGNMSMGACYPGEGLTTEMASVDIYGLKRGDRQSITSEVLLNQPFTGKIKLYNPSSLALTNIRVEPISLPENCTITFNQLASLAGKSSGELSYTVKGTAVSESKNWEEIKARVITEEGPTLDVTIYYACRTEKGTLISEQPVIKTTMTKELHRDYQLNIANIGKGETGRISVNIPDVPWMRLVSPLEMTSLQFGETATIVLRLQSTDDMPLNIPVEGTIGVNCANGTGFLLPFHITPVSDAIGTLKIDVCNESTYNTVEKPHLNGAQVRVTTPTNKLIVEGVTDNNGLFVKELPEGYYIVEVTADEHDVYRNTILVDPGIETLKVINLSMQGIKISYSVERIEIEDKYEIVMETQFETNIPVPVILTTISMPQRSTNDLLRKGESFIATATLTNKGLIAAQDVQLLMPENTQPLIFEPFINEPFDLPAQSSKIIPVKITYSPQSTLRASSSNDDSFTEDDGLFEGCTYHWGTAYFWDCGFDKKWHKYYTPVKIYDDCGEPLVSLPKIPLPSFGGGGSGGGSLGIPGGWFDSNPNNGGYVDIPSAPVVNQDKNCIPCATGMTVATLKCAGHWIPAAEEVMAAKELWDAFIEALKGVVMEESGANEVIDAAYNSLTKEQQKFLKNRMDDLDLGNFFADALQSVLNCRNLSYNQSFEAVMACVSGVTESADQFFDEALGTMFDKLYPNPTPIQTEQLKKVKKLGKKAVDAVGKLLNVADCLHDFATACDHLLEQQPVSSKLRSTAVPGYLMNFSSRMAVASKEMNAYANIWLSIFGENAVWQECAIDDLACILRELPTKGTILAENVANIKPKEVPISEWEWFIDRWNNTIAGHTSGNYIDINRINNLQQVMSDMNEQVLSWGYKSLSECITKEIEIVQEKIAGGSNSVCSTISLQFKQTMTMTREAFRGTLTVFNGHESIAMNDVRLNLEVKDEDGIVATSHEIEIKPEKLDGFEGKLDGVWTLDAQKTGFATILFIPSKHAAPTEPKDYSFGGTLSYIDPFTGLEVTRDLFPVTLTVNPSPNLKLTYFVQRNILGDDPLTTNKVEPSVPAEFSLLIQNTGAGDATKVNMVTNQPEIIDNEKKLAIDFEILNSVLNGKEKSLALGGSVATNFGTIPAGQTAYAQWWFTSTLLGHFTDYKVEATHVTSYDNPDLSLLDGEPTIHELIRSIKVTGSDLTGFLVNDLVDAEDTPDMIYLTDGTMETVSKASAKIEKKGDQYILTVTPSAKGWSYGSLTDPTGGRQKLVSITRQDGQLIDLQNVWQTGCTLRDGKDPLYENRIHFADKVNGNTTYQLTFEPGPDVILEVASFEGIPDNNEVAEKTITEITVHFNKAIEPETFTTEDLTLVLQGQQRDVSSIHIVQKDKQTFVLDLTEVSKLDGFYVLTVQTAGITDHEGFLGESGKSVSWTQYLAPGYQTLSMELASGWNWISTNMEGVNNPVSLLAPVKEKTKRMQSQSQEVTNDPLLGLVGNLEKVTPETFYKLEMNANGKIDITGTVLTPNQVKIDLKAGWNWIGYIPRSATTPTKALALLTANVGDEVKGQAGFAQFNGSTWVGTLDKMEPGKGYMYKAAKSQTFQYPIVSPLDATVSLRSIDLRSDLKSPWIVDIHKYPNNMSIVANLWLDKVKQEPDQYVVAAFCGDECRGIGKYVEGKLFITVYGDKAGENITFRAVLNGGTSQWKIKETVSFSETTQGTLAEPFDLHLSEQVTGNDIILTQNGIYPNPVSRLLFIKGNTEDIQRIQVVGGNGAVLMNQGLNGGNSIDVSTLSAGLYILIIERNNESEFHKFIKK